LGHCSARLTGLFLLSLSRLLRAFRERE
jgi:hypothetical protein